MIRPLQRTLGGILPIGIFCALILGAVGAHAGIYEYVDEDGVTHYTSTPSDSQSILFIEREEDIEPEYSRDDQFGDLGDEDGVTQNTDAFSDPHYIFFIGGKGVIEVSYSGTDRFEDLIQQAAAPYNVDPALVKAIIQVESGFNPWAVSTKGAMGLMQLLPETAERLSVMNVFDPWENIHAGVRHLADLLDTFQNDLELSLAAYNAGRSVVLRFRSIPPYDETQEYVKKVLRYYQAYKQSSGNGLSPQSR